MTEVIGAPSVEGPREIDPVKGIAAKFLELLPKKLRKQKATFTIQNPDPTDVTSVEVESVPVGPWQRRRDDRLQGIAILPATRFLFTVTREDDVMIGSEAGDLAMDKKIVEGAYRLDVPWNPFGSPTLMERGPTQQTSPGKDPWRIVQDPKNVQSLFTLVNGLSREPSLSKEATLESREEMIRKHIERIIQKAKEEDEVVVDEKGSERISFSFGPMTVDLTKYTDRYNTYGISITEPQAGKEKLEMFSLSTAGLIKIPEPPEKNLKTLSVSDSKPILTMLEVLTEQEIAKQLAARQKIRTLIEGMVNASNLEVTDGYRTSQRKSHFDTVDEDSSSFIAVGKEWPFGKEPTNAISSYTTSRSVNLPGKDQIFDYFYLAPGNPLTYRKGEQGDYFAATEGEQNEYIKFLEGLDSQSSSL